MIPKKHASSLAVCSGVAVGVVAVAIALGMTVGRAAADAPVGRYQAIASGEVLDTQTGLVWQKGYSDLLDFKTAQSHCTGLNLNGHTWRAPSVNELQTLVDERKTTAPLLDTSVFSESGTDFWRWTSTPVAGRSTQDAWWVDFRDGRTGYGGQDNNLFPVRCVR